MLTLLKINTPLGKQREVLNCRGGVFILITGFCNLEIVGVFAWELLNILSGTVLLILVLVVLFVKFKVF